MTRTLSAFKSSGDFARGYAVVALDRPKSEVNVGAAMRAVGCFGASMLIAGGARFKPGATDTQKSYRHTPYLRVKDVWSFIPYDCIPVAVEMVEGAVPLESFIHPERAFYLFGPEDGSIQASFIERCVHRVRISTSQCLNLAAAVSIVLYDRQAKMQAKNG